MLCCVWKYFKIVYWGNKKINKLTGLQVKLPEDNISREKNIYYVLSAFSFIYLPINYINIVENDNKITFDRNCYIQSGGTFFSKSHTLFTTIDKI